MEVFISIPIFIF